MLQEAFRHLKAIGAWGDGVDVLADAGIQPGLPGRAHRQEGERQDGRGADRRTGPAPGVGPHPADRRLDDPSGSVTARLARRPSTLGR